MRWNGGRRKNGGMRWRRERKRVGNTDNLDNINSLFFLCQSWDQFWIVAWTLNRIQMHTHTNVDTRAHSHKHRHTQTHTHAYVQSDLSRGWLRMFRITNAMETASLEDVSEKGMLKGDHGVAAHPGCVTVREIEKVSLREKGNGCVCVCVCVRVWKRERYISIEKLIDIKNVRES